MPFAEMTLEPLATGFATARGWRSVTVYTHFGFRHPHFMITGQTVYTDLEQVDPMLSSDSLALMSAIGHKRPSGRQG